MKRNFAINEAYMEIARKNDSFAAYQKECFDKGYYNMEEIDRHWDLKKHGFSFQSVMNDVFVKNQDKNKVFYVTKDNYSYCIVAKNGKEKFLWRFDNDFNHILYRFQKWVGDDTVVIVNFLFDGVIDYYRERVKTGEYIVFNNIEIKKGVKILYNGGLSEKEVEDYKKKIDEYNKVAEPEDYKSVVRFLEKGGFVKIEGKDANFSCGSKKNFYLYTLVDFEKGDKVITDHDDRVQEIVEVTVDSHGNKKFKLSQATGLWSANQLSPADKKAKGWIEIRPNVWWCGESDEEDEYCWLFFKNKKYVHFPFDYISQEGVEISFTEGIMDAQSIVERSNKAIDFEKLANDVDNWTKNFSFKNFSLYEVENNARLINSGNLNIDKERGEIRINLDSIDISWKFSKGELVEYKVYDKLDNEYKVVINKDYILDRHKDSILKYWKDKKVLDFYLPKKNTAKYDFKTNELILIQDNKEDNYISIGNYEYKNKIFKELENSFMNYVQARNFVSSITHIGSDLNIYGEIQNTPSFIIIEELKKLSPSQTKELDDFATNFSFLDSDDDTLTYYF